MSGARLAVVDYGIGNLRSAHKALQHVGADVQLVDDPARIGSVDAVVLPGVGAFGPTMAALHSTGFAAAVTDFIASGRPFLGICVGMQVLYRGSEEAPSVAGLGVFPEMVRRLPDDVKVPQMQWNQIVRWQGPGPGGGGDGTAPGSAGGPAADTRGGDALLAGLGEAPWLYFVHSYAADPTEDTVAVCTYGRPFSAAVRRGNVFATQFHPEKSGSVGIRVLSNFVAVVGSSRLGTDDAMGTERQAPEMGHRETED